MHSSGLALKNALLTGEGGKIVAGLGGHALSFVQYSGVRKIFKGLRQELKSVDCSFYIS